MPFVLGGAFPILDWDSLCMKVFMQSESSRLLFTGWGKCKKIIVKIAEIKKNVIHTGLPVFGENVDTGLNF